MRWLLGLGLIFLSGGVMAAPIHPKSSPTEPLAIFAGGCFWCMEAEFANVPGVSKVISGYTGGESAQPTYEEVSAGGTGHLEAIAVRYDPATVDYARLLDIFWSNIDPLDADGQFCDKGAQYRAGIFTVDAAQQSLAEASRKAMEAKLGQTVATLIRPATVFWPAEDYHQEYFIKNRDRYKRYRMGCGRDQRLEELRRKTMKAQEAPRP